MKIYGVDTQNTKKVLYTAQELNLNYEFVLVDLVAGEHRTENFLKMNPVGKVPVLEHHGKYLFESGAICRYLANISNSALYPTEHYQRAIVDEWLDFFTSHLGFWLNSMFYETIIKAKFPQLGKTNATAVEQSQKLIEVFGSTVDKHLTEHKYLANDKLSIADLFAYAYVEQVHLLNLPIDHWPALGQWLKQLSSLNSITEVQKRFS